MRVIPRTLAEQLTFFESHRAVWTDEPEAIGLTQQQADAIDAATTQARLAYNAAQRARVAAQNATLDQKIAFEHLRRLGGSVVATVRAFARVNEHATGDPAGSIYSRASLPTPAQPTPLGPPKAPTGAGVRLDTAGHATVTFHASKAGGTSWIIQRRTIGVMLAGLGTGGLGTGGLGTGGTGGLATGGLGRTLAPHTSDWHTVGVTETQSFTDRAVPRGLDSVQYRVIATRSGGASAPSQMATLQFGTADPPPLPHSGLIPHSVLVPHSGTGDGRPRERRPRAA